MSGRFFLRSPFESLRVSGQGRIPLRERALQRDGALHRSGDRPKRGHEAVAHRLHLRPAVRLQHLARDPLVLAQHLAPLLVAAGLPDTMVWP